MTDEVIVPSEPEVVTPSWFIDDGRPGDGERPTWLNEKFKSAADLAKSYHELEKKVGAAPDEYDLSTSRFLDPDYVPMQELLQLAKDKRVPKDVIDKMVDSIDRYMDEFSIDYSEEATKLGENANERLTTLDNWAKANLTEGSYEALTNNLKSADAIKALEELRGKMMSNTTIVPGGNDAASTNVETIDQVRTDLSNNLAKYKSDPVFQKEIAGRFERAAKSTNFVDKTGY